MKTKRLLFATISLFSLTAFTGCGNETQNTQTEGAKVTIKDFDGTQDLFLGKSGKVTSYIVLDMSQTDLKTYKAHDVLFTTDNLTDAKVERGHIDDFKPGECYWTVTFSAVGQYKVTAHLGGKVFNSISYTVNPGRLIDFEYKAPTATNFSYTLHSKQMDNDIKIYKIGDDYLKQLSGKNIVFFKSKGEGKYLRYGYNTDTKTWNAPRETTKQRVINVVYSEAMPPLPDEYDLKMSGQATIKTTTSSGTEDKVFETTIYKHNNVTFELVNCDAFAFSVHTVVEGDYNPSDDTINEINYTISTFPMDVPTE